MKTHTDTRDGVFLMWREGNKVNFNVNKSTTFSVGDEVIVNSGSETTKFFKIKEIKNTRQSSMSDFLYVETIAELLTIK